MVNYRAFEDSATWDESHVSPIVEIAHTENVGGERALEILAEELDDTKDKWLEQYSDMIDEEGADEDGAFEAYKAAFLAASAKRVPDLERPRMNPGVKFIITDGTEQFVYDEFSELDPARAAFRDVDGPAKLIATSPDGCRETLMMRTGDARTSAGARISRRVTARKNPNHDTEHAAITKYEEFHRLKPTKIAEFSITIPSKVTKLGKGVNVLYESGKKDPETLRKPKKPLSYIHDHDAGVHAYKVEPGGDESVPDFIKHAQALVVLGKCLGFSYEDGEGKHDVEATTPLPDLCCTVDGRALLVVQSRREVLAMIWGGALGVEARGIVG